MIHFSGAVVWQEAVRILSKTFTSSVLSIQVPPLSVISADSWMNQAKNVSVSASNPGSFSFFLFFCQCDKEVLQGRCELFVCLLTVLSLLCCSSQVYVRVIHLIAMCVPAPCASRYALAMCCASNTTSRNEFELRLLFYLPLPPPLSPPPGSTSLSSRTEGGACSQWREGVHTYEVYEREGER